MDRNFVVSHFVPALKLSLSARRAWIEIRQQPAGEKQRTVALRKESVDRNIVFCLWAWMGGVALRKESVDRNADKDCDWVRVYVALRKESVDRNPWQIRPPLVS